jgi:hypothetical protein
VAEANASVWGDEVSSRKQVARKVDGDGDVGRPMRRVKAKAAGAEPSALTQQELEAVKKWCSASKTPKVKISKVEDHARLEADHPIKAVGVALLLESFGTTDHDFLSGLLKQLAALTSPDSQVDERELNFLLSIIDDVKPRDQLESLLAAQLAAVHMAMMTLGSRLAKSQTIIEQDSAQQAFNKLARTFVAQLDGLKRYRSGGEQKVTVQHVNVTAGGQAIVGHVTQAQTETQSKKAAAAATPLLTDAKAVPMAPIDASRTKLPVAARRGARR